MSSSSAEVERTHANTHAGGRCSGCWSLARVAAAEALGTALLVLLSTAPLPAPLRAGLTVAALVQCFGPYSGAQLNPCVSAAALLCGRMAPRRAAAEVLAQLAGAALGAALLRDARAGVAAPGAGVSALRALGAEALCGAVLALANCAAWSSRGPPSPAWPLCIGSTVAALAAFAGEVSGGSMNPARAFGPALLASHWDRHWVYWVGPLGGSCAATGLYAALWRSAGTPRSPRAPRRKPPAAAADE